MKQTIEVPWKQLRDQEMQALALARELYGLEDQVAILKRAINSAMSCGGLSSDDAKKLDDASSCLTGLVINFHDLGNKVRANVILPQKDIKAL